MIIRVLHRFDIIGLGPDSPEDEEGIKASSEICKFSGGFQEWSFGEWDIEVKKNTIYSWY